MPINCKKGWKIRYKSEKSVNGITAVTVFTSKLLASKQLIVIHDTLLIHIEPVFATIIWLTTLEYAKPTWSQMPGISLIQPVL